MTPYYEHAGITIYHGDCMEVLPILSLSKDTAIIADPPYGIDFDTDYTRFKHGEFNQDRKTHKPVHGDDKAFNPKPFLEFKTVILWGSNCYSNALPTGTLLIWDKRFENGKAFLADAEVAWMNKGYGVYIFSCTQQGFVRNEPIQHPTQKPVAVMKWCIQKAGLPTLICDPFTGSGTTLCAAKEMCIKAIGIEIEEKYCEIAAKRLQQEVFNFE